MRSLVIAARCGGMVVESERMGGNVLGVKEETGSMDAYVNLRCCSEERTERDRHVIAVGIGYTRFAAHSHKQEQAATVMNFN